MLSGAAVMTALGLAQTCREVGLVPHRTYAPQRIASLFDHRVGALVQKPRHLKTERLRCFEREKSPQRRG
jgi:hypothetical protein